MFSSPLILSLAFGFCLFVLRQVLLCNLVCPQTHYEVQAVLLLPQPLDCWDNRHVPPCFTQTQLFARDQTPQIEWSGQSVKTHRWSTDLLSYITLWPKAIQGTIKLHLRTTSEITEGHRCCLDWFLKEFYGKGRKGSRGEGSPFQNRGDWNMTPWSRAQSPLQPLTNALHSQAREQFQSS